MLKRSPRMRLGSYFAFMLLTAASLSSCSISSNVTPEARGRVIDGSSGMPLQGLLVTVTHELQTQATAEASSSPSGQFIVPAARGKIYPMGTAVMIRGVASFQASGYQTKKLPVELSESAGYRYSSMGIVRLTK